MSPRPVAVPRPRFVGVLADGTTPFTAEKRLPGTDLGRAAGIAGAQWEGVMAALDAVSPGEVRQWGGRYQPTVVLTDPARGTLTVVVEWR